MRCEEDVVVNILGSVFLFGNGRRVLGLRHNNSDLYQWQLDYDTGNRGKKNPDTCVDTVYYAINVTDTNYRALLSSVLAAQMANKTVHFYLAGCSGQNGNYPNIVSIQINS